jgi:hypothetical protein
VSLCEASQFGPLGIDAHASVEHVKKIAGQGELQSAFRRER